MGGAIGLNAIDLTIFAACMVFAVVLGFLVAGRHRKTAKGYFLGDRRLPWYVVGTSMIAADISADDLIANAGGAYQYGTAWPTGLAARSIPTLRNQATFNLLRSATPTYRTRGSPFGRCDPLILAPRERHRQGTGVELS